MTTPTPNPYAPVLKYLEMCLKMAAGTRNSKLIADFDKCDDYERGAISMAMAFLSFSEPDMPNHAFINKTLDDARQCFYRTTVHLRGRK